MLCFSQRERLIKNYLEEKNNKMKKIVESMKLRGRLRIVAKHADGTVFGVRDIANLITFAGYAEVAQLIGYNLSGTVFRYIGSGTGASAATTGDTDLGTQVGDKQTATVTNTTTNETNDTVHFVATQAYTGTSAITEAGLFNNSTAATGDMLARQVFSALNVVNGDSIEFTWDIIISV